MDAKIEQVSSTDVHAWLVGDDEEVIVIDPGSDATAVLTAVGEREIIAVAVAAWLAMRFAAVVHRALRDNGVELLTRIAGLLLSAIAIQLVAQSAIAFAAQAG